MNDDVAAVIWLVGTTMLAMSAISLGYNWRNSGAWAAAFWGAVLVLVGAFA